MAIKTLRWSTFLLLVVATIIYFVFQNLPSQHQQGLSPTPTPTPSVNAHTVLTLVPARGADISEITQHTLAVLIDTGDNQVNSVQLELAYDPQALTSVTLIPGTFFTQPTTLADSINTTNGHIFYALAQQMSLPGKSGKGTLALLSFNVSPTYTGKTTTISFQPKTAIAADRILESVLKKTSDYTLTITPAASHHQ
jgi:hypothetical protein